MRSRLARQGAQTRGRPNLNYSRSIFSRRYVPLNSYLDHPCGRHREKTFFEAGIFGDSDIHNKTQGDEGFGISSRFVVSPIHSDSKIFHLGIAVAFRKANATGFNDDGSEIEKSFSYSSGMSTHIENRKSFSNFLCLTIS